MVIGKQQGPTRSGCRSTTRAIQPALDSSLPADRVYSLQSTSDVSCTARVRSGAFRTAFLLLSLGLVRPVTADVFDCTHSITEDCLSNSVDRANRNGQANTILLGVGTYQLATQLPGVTSPMTIRGMGAGNTQIHGTCTAAKKDRATKEPHKEGCAQAVENARELGLLPYVADR